MRTIILGAGQVGSSIAKSLLAEDNHITLVDHSVEVLKKVIDVIDVQPVEGFASHPDVLERAGAAEADLLVAVTSDDEVNLVACEVARSLFKVKTKIARLKQQTYLNPAWKNTLFAPQNLAIDVVIAPEVEVAHTIFRSIRVPGACEVLSLMNNQIRVVGISCHHSASLLNTPLRLLPTTFPKLHLVVLFVNRAGAHFIPTDDDVLQQGDEIYFAVATDQLKKAQEAFGLPDHQGQNLLILGGGNIGLILAREIERHLSGVVCRIIEKDPERAEWVASQLQNTEVICGDALDLEILSEANVKDSETVLAVTQDDKVNVLSALLAKREGAQRAMTLLNNTSYSSLVTSLGVDAVISPRSVTVSTILQHIRRGRIRSLYSLGHGMAEIIEVEAFETAPVIGLFVKDLNLPRTIRVIALLREETVWVDPARHLLRRGDRILLVVTQSAIRKIESLFVVKHK